MTDIVYDRFLSGVYGAEYDLTSNRLRVILVSGSYNAATGNRQANDNTYAQVYPHEINGAGYDSGGQRLTGTLSLTGTANNITGIYDALDVQWPNITFSEGSGLVVYYSGGVDRSSSPLIHFHGFPSVTDISSGPFSIQWSDSPLGVLRLRVTTS